ncbi:MAG: HD domain-containing protein [Pseudonocardiaceae bacterium]
MTTLLKTVSVAHPGADTQQIERAYAVAARSHRGQRRKSGDPYITHPVAVATIVAELGMSAETVCAALLHDTVEDTPCTLAQLREEFGEEIAARVDGINSPEKSRLAEATVRLNTDCTSARRSQETEVLVLKLADRLHNMRTMRYLPPGRQQLISREVLQVNAPLAHLLGMDTLKRELEDLASEILYPRLPHERRRTVAKRALATLVVLLPSATRARWLEEWTGELSVLPTRRARARFVVQMLYGIPRLAVTLRRPLTRDAPRLTSTIVDRVSGVLGISGVLLAAVAHWELAAWAAGVMVLGCLALLAAVLFARSDDPARRLRGLIHAWRDPSSIARSSRRRRNRSGST